MKQEEEDWIVNILVCLYWFVLQIVALLKRIMFSERKVWTEYMMMVVVVVVVVVAAAAAAAAFFFCTYW
jgi:hypothetical protein